MREIPSDFESDPLTTRARPQRILEIGFDPETSTCAKCPVRPLYLAFTLKSGCHQLWASRGTSREARSQATPVQWSAHAKRAQAACQQPAGAPGGLTKASTGDV